MFKRFTNLIPPTVLIPQKLATFCVCRIYSGVIQTIMEANTMNPDQTASLGAIESGSILFAIQDILEHIQKTERSAGKRLTTM